MNFEQLKSELQCFITNINDEQVEKLHRFMDIVLTKNKAFNLTAIKDEETFVEKMILDSALAGHDFDFNGKNTLDVGSGAGFPGIVLAILYPQGQFVLLEATRKKCVHLKEVAKELGLDNVCVINDRAEIYIRNHREYFDAAIARAVAALNVLIELCVPFVKVGGNFIAMKSQKAEEEYNVAYLAMKRLNITLLKKDKYILPESKEDRTNLIFVKNKENDTRYPRDYKFIITKPL